MRRSDDVTLARRLAEALDGRAQATGELEAIVRVLEAAAAEARFDVAADETERALADGAAPAAAGAPALARGGGRGRGGCRSRSRWCSPRRSARRRPWTSRPRRSPRSAGPATCSRWSSGSRPARRAGSPRRPAPAGSTPPAAGRPGLRARRPARSWTRRCVERGRITRYDPATRTRGRGGIRAPPWRPGAPRRSTRSRSTGRRSSARRRRRPHSVTFAGRSAYRFSLPVQRLARCAPASPRS